MAKSFDRVNWDLLLQVLSQIGFSPQWCNLIHQCISTTSMVVLVNGSPGKFFKPSRGLRQGDPLSPYLFLFCMESLSRYLTHAETQQQIQGIKICKDAPAINHLLFVDDCMIFCKANMQECNNLIQIFYEFGKSSGKLINFSKFGIFFSKNTAPDIDDNISNTMKVQRINTYDKYLRSPLFTTKSKIQAFNLCVYKLKFRFAGWKTNLSTAGKMTVIQSVTSTSSIYQMNCFKIPKTTCNEINAIQRDFFWNKEQDKSEGLYYFAWDGVNKPKELGGLANNLIASWNETYATICWFIWKARCDWVLRKISPDATVPARDITQHLCNYSRVHHKLGHIINNLFYQSNSSNSPPENYSQHRHTSDKFGITISMHIELADLCHVTSDAQSYTNYSFVAMSFTGKCMGTRNFKDYTSVIRRAERSSRGAQLALTWGKTMPQTNINFAAETEETLQAIKTSYQLEVQHRFKGRISSIQGNNNNNAPIDFVLGKLITVTAQQNYAAINLARIARQSTHFYDSA
ncbi:uncharacterized protein LOC113331256 [Papaver somniferum]|uniref:uncharacterized protein LOC113331256 n=1 Tax=Papaver somniferum TaxID=3469 RepID=UPI000E6FBB36|nr:uncharacterized protein LOC113331256 [Papaver somniferum]